MEDSPIFAFILMPFAGAFDDLYQLGIKEPAERLGIIAERVDEQIYSDSILERIYRQIDLADVIVADMSGRNANVFYEVGYAHAKSKVCILLTDNPEDIPFDLKHRRHVVYEGSIDRLRKAITEELEWVKRDIQNVRKSRIKVNLARLSGTLDRNSHYAKASVDFHIDLSNESDRPSAEIESMYFYSSGDWEVKQGHEECSSTASDLANFPKRHFLKPPVRRLPANAWAPINFRTTKVLAWAFKGEELKASYQLNGRAILRLVTAEGHFDNELTIDIEVDEIPF